MTTVRTAAAAISRMPARVQDAVSRCLADGGTWRDVASLCAAEGYPNVNAQNVTNYRKGAHKDWLARQERLVAARDRYAWKVDLLKNTRKREALRKPDWRLPWTCWKAHLTAWTCPTSKP